MSELISTQPKITQLPHWDSNGWQDAIIQVHDEIY